jgi:hypothetical protein
MDNHSDNRESFDQYVETYFSGVEGISAISLVYKSDYTATVVATTANRDITKNMPVGKDDVRQMLSGLTQKLGVMAIRWKSVSVDIQKRGVVTVNISW